MTHFSSVNIADPSRGAPAAPSCGPREEMKAAAIGALKTPAADDSSVENTWEQSEKRQARGGESRKAGVAFLQIHIIWRQSR